MKMTFCADLLLNARCTENLNTAQLHTWQAARKEKLVELIDKAAQGNVAYIAFYGQMFGSERVSESVIDSFFQIVREDSQIQMLAFLDQTEYRRMTYRNDIPENLHLICVQTATAYTDENIALRINEERTELQLADNDPVVIVRDERGNYSITGMSEAAYIPKFEPIGFDDAEVTYGYGVFEWSDETLGKYILINNQKYCFQTRELRIMPNEGQKEIISKLNASVKDIARDTFLRITLKGRSAFGLSFNVDSLKNQLQSRIFFVEVYDNTMMDIDEEAFENDISLRSEYVRLVLQDDSLSETERNRLISCGWNVLNGREADEE